MHYVLFFVLRLETGNNLSLALLPHIACFVLFLNRLLYSVVVTNTLAVTKSNFHRKAL